VDGVGKWHPSPAGTRMSRTGPASSTTQMTRRSFLQVPDFGDRFWVYALYDARTDQLSNIGKQYGTKPGFYMVVGRTGRVRRRRELRRCCNLPRRWSSPSHAYSWTTRRTGRHPTADQSDRLLPDLALRRANEDRGLEQTPPLPRAQIQWRRRGSVGEPRDLFR
jgi:hypothetical protein